MVVVLMVVDFVVHDRKPGISRNLTCQIKKMRKASARWEHVKMWRDIRAGRSAPFWLSWLFVFYAIRMTEFAETRPSLIFRVRDTDDRRAWEEFVDIYTPLVYAFCYKHGLQEADASDVAQEVMRAVARAMQKFEYDQERSRFRNWMFTVVKSKLNNHFNKRKNQPVGTGRTTILDWLNDQATIGEAEKQWTREYQKHILRTAADRIRDEFKETSWQAFWRTAVGDEPVKTVADDLGLSLGAFYTAKSRVTSRLREEVRTIDEDWPEGFLSAS